MCTEDCWSVVLVVIILLDLLIINWHINNSKIESEQDIEGIEK